MLPTPATNTPLLPAPVPASPPLPAALLTLPPACAPLIRPPPVPDGTQLKPSEELCCLPGEGSLPPSAVTRVTNASLSLPALPGSLYAPPLLPPKRAIIGLANAPSTAPDAALPLLSHAPLAPPAGASPSPTSALPFHTLLATAPAPASIVSPALHLLPPAQASLLRPPPWPDMVKSPLPPSPAPQGLLPMPTVQPPAPPEPAPRLPLPLIIPPSLLPASPARAPGRRLPPTLDDKLFCLPRGAMLMPDDSALSPTPPLPHPTTRSFVRHEEG
ncbi:hypothetical protein AX14_011580 [Amanita brunnescens Koide BX004]|nr:hypothetical protein AX14_011580 [Amanita brunnescens Koide BX004]